MTKDRYVRKHGGVVDTAGSVARALERAYKQGFADAQGSPANAVLETHFDDPLEWTLIPPRPRHAFWSCCMRTFSRGDLPGRLVPAVTERGTKGWQLVVEGSEPEKAVGEGTMQVLIRLGLIEPDLNASENLKVSTRGRATWERFLANGGQFPDDLTAF